MKKIIALCMVGLLSLAWVLPIHSATESTTIPVTATITAGTPDATFAIYKAPSGLNIDFGTSYTSMAFSSFTFTRATVSSPDQWVSNDHFAVVAWANGMGRRYKIQSAGSGTFTRTGGIETLPVGSFGCLPVYAAQDRWTATDPATAQGAQPSGSTLAGQFNAVTGSLTTWADVYTSETPAGSSRIIQVRYGFFPLKSDGSIPYTGYNYIPATQATGTYSGVNVKVRITAI